ncbi:helix-turn-helix transcriptional regulator [Actinomadura roseirufa]|uniref:helix-turn-helix transcriptional regulator n=1 Tax=Actinomadura roseirufa TaxID=2094049 RepID=UPI001A955119|nr:response regulator transcription factor [Actinomadura roseirufa]
MADTINVVLHLRDGLERYGLERMLQGLDVVRDQRSADDLETAVEGAARAAPTVLIVSHRDLDETARPVLHDAASRGVRALVLVPGGDVPRAGRLAGLACGGFLSTGDLGRTELRHALTRVADGEVPIPAPLARSLLGPSDPAPPRMTPREHEVLPLLARGLSNKQIARRLSISQHGAKRLVANILAKLDSPNRTVAVTRMLSLGLCDHPG